MVNSVKKTVFILLLVVLAFTFSSQTSLAKEIFSENAWQVEPDYPMVVASHVTLSKDNYIYVLGGGTNNAFSTVYMAETDDNGINSLGWQRQADLPSSVQFHSGLIVGDNIYTFGGSPNGFIWFNKVFHAKIASDGTISTWSQTTGLPENLKLGGVAEKDNYIYYFGGSVGNVVSDNIYRAYINPIDGSLMQWEEVGKVPNIESAFRLMKNDDQIYLYFGHFAGETGNNTYRGKFMEDGTIGDWTALPNSIFTLRRPYFYEGSDFFAVLGGNEKFRNEPNSFKQDIYFINKNQLDQNQWTLSQINLPEQNCCGDRAVISNGRLYMTAGFNGAYLNSTYSIALSSPDPLLNLPFDYPNRLEENNEEDFKDAFNNRVTSVFDHEYDKGLFLNYLGEASTKKCEKDASGYECYDGHAGYDFSRHINDGEDLSVFAAADGVVVHKSESLNNNENSNANCIPDAKAFGCVIILEHDIENHPHLYTLYAHLDEILLESDDYEVLQSEQIAKMGSTGGDFKKHLHFSVLKGDPINSIGLNSFKSMDKNDWTSIVNQAELSKTSYCNYTAPNGLVFHPVDPSGWEGDGIDPWFESCGQENELLWKYPPNL